MVQISFNAYSRAISLTACIYPPKGQKRRLSKTRYFLMKVAVVTGSNRSIGLALCEELAKQYFVLATCRQSSPELESLSDLHSLKVITGIDIKDENCHKLICKELGNRKIDLLVNNAGTWEEKDDPITSTVEGFSQVLAINAFAPFKLSLKLIDFMADDAKVAFITSYRGSIQRLNKGEHPHPLEDISYNCSKLVLNMLALTLREYLKGYNQAHNKCISTIILHPGYVSTRMTEFKGTIKIEDSVQGMIREINKLTLEASGKFVNHKGEELPF